MVSRRTSSSTRGCWLCLTAPLPRAIRCFEVLESRHQERSARSESSSATRCSQAVTRPDHLDRGRSGQVFGATYDAGGAARRSQPAVSRMHLDSSRQLAGTLGLKSGDKVEAKRMRRRGGAASLFNNENPSIAAHSPALSIYAQSELKRRSSYTSFHHQRISDQVYPVCDTTLGDRLSRCTREASRIQASKHEFEWLQVCSKSLSISLVLMVT